MWFWMTDCILLQHVLEYPRKWCAYSTVWLLQHRCQVPIFVHISCIPYKHAPVYSHFIKTYICSVYVCLAVTCHQHFGQNDQDLLHAAAVIQGGIDIKVRVSTASWPQRRKFTHHTCRDSNLQPFNRESSALPLSYPCSTFFYTTSKFNLPNHKQSTEPQLWTQKRCNQVRNSNNKHISIVTFHLTTTTWSIISIPSMNPKLYALCGINWGEKIYGITNVCLV